MPSRGALLLATFAALAGAAGVVAAAAGAHATPDLLMTTAANFLLFHAGALLGTSALARTLPGRAPFVLAAGTLMAVSVTLFSGELIVRAETGMRLLPLVAPIGGGGLILSWVGLAGAVMATAFKKPVSPST